MGLCLVYSICFPTLINSASVHTPTPAWQSWDMHGVSVDTLSELLHPSKGWGQPAKPQAAGNPSGSVPPGAISDFLLLVALGGFSQWPSLGTGSEGGRGARAG